VVAEICIGGMGVARGYLGRPDETAEKFLADPFSPETGARMYRTGELGRWRPDGELEFIGRQDDDQVKIRGFRIELGEIEGCLLACHGVGEAAAALFDRACSKQIAAYVTARHGQSMDVDGLRAELSKQLPDYMLPSAFVQLDRLPLTHNGKLDRAALPEPQANDLGLRPYEAPQGEVEQTIAEIWQELLDQPRIGRHDNFFDLGGHSLLVVSLVERLRKKGLVGEVSAIFGASTLIGYAACLHRAQARSTAEEEGDGFPQGTTSIVPSMVDLVDLTQEEIDRLVTAIPGGASNIKDIYPLMPLQEGMLFHHLLESLGDTYLSRTQVAFETRKELDRFLAALQDVIEHHDILRCAFRWESVRHSVQVVQRSAQLPVH